MKDVRRQIDEIDRQIIELFEQRMELSREAGRYKRSHDRGIYDEERERAILVSREQMVKNVHNGDYVRALMLHMLAASRREQRRGMNVYLIGMPGCGKSTFAKRIGERTGMNVIDTDALVEETAGMPITEIFKTEGETGFRKREREALIAAAAKGYSVVATGGGILTFARNLSTLKSSGRVVFMDRALDKLILVDMEKRPLLKSRDDVKRMYKNRYATYKEAADLVMDPDEPDTLDILEDYCCE